MHVELQWVGGVAIIPRQQMSGVLMEIQALGGGVATLPQQQTSGVLMELESQELGRGVAQTLERGVVCSEMEGEDEGEEQMDGSCSCWTRDLWQLFQSHDPWSVSCDLQSSPWLWSVAL